MLIARWLFLLAGLAACTSVALYFLTRNPLFWHVAKRIFFVTIATGILFFAILIFERLTLI